MVVPASSKQTTTFDFSKQHTGLCYKETDYYLEGGNAEQQPVSKCWIISSSQ